MSKKCRLSCTLTKHHRKPKARGGDGGESNVSVVSDKKHKAFHALFGIMTPLEIAEELNVRWLDPEWVIIAVPQEDAKRICRASKKKKRRSP